MARKVSEEVITAQSYDDASNIEEIQHGQWKRIMLLVIAITVHNIPEGLAVGVGFGAIGSSSSATFESARLVVLFRFSLLSVADEALKFAESLFCGLSKVV